MAAAAHDPGFAQAHGIKPAVAAEFVHADKGRHFEGHDAGGIVAYDGGEAPPDPTSATPTTPSVQTQSPLYQNSLQRYAAMPAEKLQELAVQLPASSSQGQIVRRVLQQRHMGAEPTSAPPQQPGGIAPQGGTYEQGGGIAGRDDGGGMAISPGMASPWWTRREASQDAGMATGYLHGATLGRADHVTTAAPGGSYVVPADVVSGLGEGNSMAGANVIERMLTSGPYGTRLPAHGRGSGPPHPPRAPALSEQKGGGVSRGTIGQPIPVKLSHGEIVLTPEQVLRIGRKHFGNRLPDHRVMKLTHKLLDKWIVLERQKVIKKMKSLPGPTK